MGAYGVAAEELDNFNIEVSMRRCGLCGNNCLLTINTFAQGKEFISGNRCERGAGLEIKRDDIPNLFLQIQTSFLIQAVGQKPGRKGYCGYPKGA